MYKTPSNLWFGTEESYFAFEHAQEEVARLMLSGTDAVKAAIQMRGGNRSEDPFALPPMWEVQGDTGIVSIQGSLVNGKAGFMRLFGVTGYDDIMEAVAEAVASKDVKRIVLNIDSNGGAVDGVEDAGNFIREAASRKPVIAYTGGTMASAAYWLGVSADKTFGSKTSQSGSVGTLIIHMERSKALAEAGVKPTLVRYGKYKALANPLEPLSDEGKEHLQSLADEAGRIFVEYAASRRGVSPEKFQKTMGEGRVFMGRLAAEVGLLDGVMSFQEFGVFAKTLDKPISTTQNPRNFSKDSVMKKTAVSKAVILAILGGTAVSALGLSAVEANVEGVKLEADDLTKLTAEATEIHAAFTVAMEKAKAEAVAAAKAESDTAVADLNTKLQAATSKVALLEAGANELNNKVTAANSLAASYATIVKQSISVMSVALGGAPDVAASLAGEALLAEHQRLETAFKAKFPAGGVAATNLTPGKQNEPKKGPSAEFLARLPNAKTAA